MLRYVKTAFKRIMVERIRRQDAARRIGQPAKFDGLPPDLWGYEVNGGTLHVEGLNVVELAGRFGTPLYIVNLPWLRKTHDDFLSAFQQHIPQVRLATSYKTNPVPAVLQALHGRGTYAEVISEFELWLAAHLGLRGDRIIVNGPGKTRTMVASAVSMDVKVINIDSLGEIDVIAAEAQRLNKRAHVGVRVVSSVGWSSQFGLSIANGDAWKAFERIAQHPRLVPTGLHLHIGTGLKSVELYLRAIAEVLSFAREVRARLGMSLSIYNFGGGYGVPTVRSIDPWDDRLVDLGYPVRYAIPSECPPPAVYAAKIAKLFAERSDLPPPQEVVLEPGRAITSSAQALLLRTIVVKQHGGPRTLILDGGKNITLPLGFEAHKILPAQGLDSAFDVRCDLYGPLCHPGDVVARHLELPNPAVGDVLAVMDAGAYFVPNQMNFSNPRPAIVTVESREARLVRQRESFDDIVRLDQLVSGAP